MPTTIPMSPAKRPTPPSNPTTKPVPAEREVTFATSAELGEQLRNLEKAQVEIDRKKAEELARLRELQDRD